jgi:hypothetical protein
MNFVLRSFCTALKEVVFTAKDTGSLTSDLNIVQTTALENQIDSLIGDFWLVFYFLFFWLPKYSNIGNIKICIQLQPWFA